MSRTKILKGLFAGSVVTGTATYSASKLKIANDVTERFNIERVDTKKDEEGHFKNNNCMYVNYASSEFSTSFIDKAADMSGPYPMNLQDNAELINKAQDCCKRKATVDVKHDVYLLDMFRLKPNPIVKEIIEVGEDDAVENLNNELRY